MSELQVSIHQLPTLAHFKHRQITGVLGLGSQAEQNK